MSHYRLLAMSFALAALATQAGTATRAHGATPPVQVEIQQFKFEPAHLQVVAGTTVTWINRDGEPHTVTSIDQRFTSSAALDTDDRYSQTFGQPGNYAYVCSVHPFMRGSVTVVPAAGKP
jgi:plastocyanin